MNAKKTKKIVSYALACGMAAVLVYAGIPVTRSEDESSSVDVGIDLETKPKDDRIDRLAEIREAARKVWNEEADSVTRLTFTTAAKL